MKYKQLVLKKGEREIVFITWLDCNVQMYYPRRMLNILEFMETQGWEREMREVIIPQGAEIGQTDKPD